MKTLELNQMEELQGGLDSGDCGGAIAGVVVVGAIIIGVATGGVGFAVAGLVGSWLGTFAWMGCSSL